MSQRFLNLIRQGKTAEVASEVESDPQLVEAKDPQGVSALLWSIYSGQPLIKDFLVSRVGSLDIFEAAAAGDCARLKALLEEDAMAVHATSGDGWSPLHLAAGFGGAEAAALLIECGAHVHRVSRNPTHSQPLHSCMAQGRDFATAKLLIAQGADVNAIQAGGYTPLHQAAAAGAADLVKLLIEAGANPQNLCDQGKTPADYARQRGHADVLQALGEPAAS